MRDAHLATEIFFMMRMVGTIEIVLLARAYSHFNLFCQATGRSPSLRSFTSAFFQRNAMDCISLGELQGIGYFSSHGMDQHINERIDGWKSKSWSCLSFENDGEYGRGWKKTSKAHVWSWTLADKALRWSFIPPFSQVLEGVQRFGFFYHYTSSDIRGLEWRPNSIYLCHEKYDLLKRLEDPETERCAKSTAVWMRDEWRRRRKAKQT